MEESSEDEGPVDEDGEIKNTSRIFIYSTQDVSVDMSHELIYSKKGPVYASSLIEFDDRKKHKESFETQINGPLN